MVLTNPMFGFLLCLALLAGLDAGEHVRDGSKACTMYKYV